MHTNQHTGDGNPSPVSLFKRLARLGLGIALIIGFIGILSNIERLTGNNRVIEVLRERDIYVGAWYWDYVEEVSEAMSFMRGALGKWEDEDQKSEDGLRTD